MGQHCFSFLSAVCVDIWGFIQCFTMSTAPSSSKWQNVCTCTTTAEEEKAKTVLIFRFRWHIKEWVSRLNGTMARKNNNTNATLPFWFGLKSQIKRMIMKVICLHQIAHKMLIIFTKFLEQTELELFVAHNLNLF